MLKWLLFGVSVVFSQPRDHDLFSEVPTRDVPVWFIVGGGDHNTPAALVQEYNGALEAPLGKGRVVMKEMAHAPFMGDPEPFDAESVRIKDKVFAGNDVPNRARTERTRR